jgi:hypothetical protein
MITGHDVYDALKETGRLDSMTIYSVDHLEKMYEKHTEKLDFFRGAALTGMISRVDIHKSINEVAEMANAVALAMMRARGNE